MNRSRLTIISFILTMCVACQDHDLRVLENSGNNSYLPLQVGNYWELNPADKIDKSVVRKEVTGKATFGHQEYYQIITTWMSAAYSSRDTAYYRIGDGGFVFMLKKAGMKESNPFRLNAGEGDQWPYITDDPDQSRITLTKIETLQLNNTMVNDCKLFFYDVPNWADEEQYTYLAPGIGFVAEYSAWGFHKTLARAKIDGVIRDF